MTDWYVDDRCTNCDVARQFAPELIVEEERASRILRQPGDDAENRRLHAAVFACPTRSIRSASGQPDPALDPFPMALDDGVLICGHNSRQTAGANSYLLRRPSGTVMMIDTPRWSPGLAERYVAATGPVTDVLLTHRDHVAHGRRYADHFGARLWIHEGDLDAVPDADQVIRGPTRWRSERASPPIRCPATPGAASSTSRTTGTASAATASTGRARPTTSKSRRA